MANIYPVNATLDSFTFVDNASNVEWGYLEARLKLNAMFPFGFPSSMHLKLAK